MKILGSKRLSLAASVFLLAGSAAPSFAAGARERPARHEVMSSDNEVDPGIVIPLLTILQQSMQSKLQSQALLTLQQANNREVMLGKLALRKSSSNLVRTYAGTLIKHHKMVNDDLRALADKGQVLLHDPNTAPLVLAMDSMDAVMAKLSLMSDYRFDQAYLNTMILLHKKDIAQLNLYRSMMTQSAAKKLLNEVLPQLVTHLQAALHLKEKLSYED